MSGSYLPEDIIIEILSRSRVKSLLRFMSVSKQWRALITNPNFISSHLHLHQSSNFKLSLLLTNHTNESHGSKFGISLLGKEATFFDDQDMPFMIKKDQIRFARIVGSSNGLVCVNLLLDHTYRQILWNPALKLYWLLLESFNYSGANMWNSHSSFGFGFHHDSKAYKIVRVVQNYQEDLGIEAEVLTLGRGESWRKIKWLDNLPNDIDTSAYHSVVSKGVWYLLAIEELEFHREFIISFDMGSETFSKMQFPADSIGSRFYKMMEYKDSLAIFLGKYDHDMPNWNFDLWVLENDSWTKLFTIGKHCNGWHPLGIWNDIEVIGKDKKLVDNLILYDLSTENSRVVGKNGYQKFFQAYNYVESMLTINHIFI